MNTFAGGEVFFSGATFSGGDVDFSRAMFSGGEVDFDGAAFSGGRVDFAEVAVWSVRPSGLPGSPPPGLTLPRTN